MASGGAEPGPPGPNGGSGLSVRGRGAGSEQLHYLVWRAAIYFAQSDIVSVLWWRNEAPRTSRVFVHLGANEKKQENTGERRENWKWEQVDERTSPPL